MDVRRKDLIEEPAGRPRRNRQHAESEVDHVDMSAFAEMPPPSHSGGKRELAGSGDLETFRTRHSVIILGK